MLRIWKKKKTSKAYKTCLKSREIDAELIEKSTKRMKLMMYNQKIG